MLCNIINIRWHREKLEVYWYKMTASEPEMVKYRIQEWYWDKIPKPIRNLRVDRPQWMHVDIHPLENTGQPIRYYKRQHSGSLLAPCLYFRSRPMSEHHRLLFLPRVWSVGVDYFRVDYNFCFTMYSSCDCFIPLRTYSRHAIIQTVARSSNDVLQIQLRLLHLQWPKAK